MNLRNRLVPVAIAGIGLAALGSAALLDAQQPAPMLVPGSARAPYDKNLDPFEQAMRLKALEINRTDLEAKIAGLEQRLAQAERRSVEQSQRLDRVAVSANAAYPGYSKSFATLEIFRKLPPDYAVSYYARNRR